MMNEIVHNLIISLHIVSLLSTDLLILHVSIVSGLHPSLPGSLTTYLTFIYIVSKNRKCSFISQVDVKLYLIRQIEKILSCICESPCTSHAADFP